MDHTSQGAGTDGNEPNMVDVIDGPVGFASLKEPAEVEASADPVAVPSLEDGDDDSATPQPA